MTTRRTFRSRWNHRPEPKPEPESEDMKKARRLPLPGPGIAIKIDLAVWPAYQKLHHLDPIGIQEPKVQTKYGPGEATLLVKRVPPEGK